MFIGRRKELQVLKQAYEAPEATFVPIYGRRRVGKSELITRFIKDKPAIYLAGKRAPAMLQLREFTQEAARTLDEPLLDQLQPQDWSSALKAVTQIAARGERKLVLALDEFQWLAEASPELPSALQELWDRQWQKTGKIMLILCGSFIGFMEREVLGRESPLFGRRTAQILLRPFPYHEAAQFHPDWSIADRARAYFVCGGLPLYLRFFRQNRSVNANIAANLLDEFAPLFREPEFLLREELREIESYQAILEAIAAGSLTQARIATTSGVPQRSLAYYLQQLIGIGYVRKRHPLVGDRPNRRVVRYVLEDPLLRFWFRFVFPNLSYIQRAGSQTAFNERVRPQLPSYFGSCFERLCQEALPRLYEREGVQAGFHVGEYWGRDIQIDVVGLRDDNWTDIGECKWGAVKSPATLAGELETKVRGYPNQRGATIGRRLFSRSKPRRTPGGPNLVWHDLEDLYG